MAETPTYWSDDATDPRPYENDEPIVLPAASWLPARRNETVAAPLNPTWIIPALSIVLCLGIVAIIAAVTWAAP